MRQNEIVFPDATTRFSSRVSNYASFRPGYPAEIPSLFGLAPASRVADVGSGTGLLARVFLNAGHHVVGVEPNEPMRLAARGFASIAGRAEATTLPDHSCDLVIAGQAFHWFDPVATRREWMRILKPGCFAALVWNDRSHQSPFMRDVEELIARYARQRDADGAIRDRGRSRIGPFFAPAEPRVARFPNSQTFDFSGLRGRLLSASYMPHEAEADELDAELRPLFERHQREGFVTFEYETMVYWAALT